MTAIPAGALPGNQVAMVPKRLLQDILPLLSDDDADSIREEIDTYLNPPNPKYRKNR